MAPRASSGQSMKATLAPDQISSVAVAEHHGLALAAVGAIDAELRPAGLDEAPVGVAEFRRHLHCTVVESPRRVDPRAD